MANAITTVVTPKPSTNLTLCPVTPCRARRAGITGRGSGPWEELMTSFICAPPIPFKKLIQWPTTAYVPEMGRVPPAVEFRIVRLVNYAWTLHESVRTFPC